MSMRKITWAARRLFMLRDSTLPNPLLRLKYLFSFFISYQSPRYAAEPILSVLLRAKGVNLNVSNK